MYDMVVEDPYVLFETWFEEAKRSEPTYPDAMTVTTVAEDGMPSARILLLKGLDRRGFVFYTNTRSRKGRQLAGNPRCALCFFWKTLDRQVRVEGTVAPVSEAEADAYFATRPRGSQIGAWASDQSEPLESRTLLEGRITDLEKRFGDAPVPRPAHWSGYRVSPTRIEFWREGRYRLHDRIVYTPDGTSGWTAEQLFP